jgi:hypothetical protein
MQHRWLTLEFHLVLDEIWEERKSSCRGTFSEMKTYYALIQKGNENYIIMSHICVVPGRRICDCQVNTALKLNVIQTVNVLEVREIQYFRSLQLSQYRYLHNLYSYFVCLRNLS